MLWLVALGAAALHGSPRLPSQPTLAARATPRCVAPLLSEPSPVDLDANAAATNAAVSNAAVSNAAAADAAAASGGRLLLGAVTVMYATNYPTIKLMNEMLSDGGAAEVSVLRFLVAALDHVETKVAQALTSWHLRGSLHRQSMPQAARSFSQPRPISRSGGPGHIGACFRRQALALAPVLVALGARERRFVSWPLARDGLSVGACFAAAYAAQVSTSCATHTRCGHVCTPL